MTIVARMHISEIELVYVCVTIVMGVLFVKYGDYNQLCLTKLIEIVFPGSENLRFLKYISFTKWMMVNIFI
jgi:hypothetical protein